MSGFTSTSYNFTSDLITNIESNDGRNLKLFSFWTGLQDISDTGLESKNITVTGIEYTTAFVKMTNIDIVVNNGETITLTGMKNSNLNTTWIIESFSYNVITPNVVEWSLTLEKYY